MQSLQSIVEEAQSLQDALRHAPLDNRSFTEWTNLKMAEGNTTKSEVVKRSGLNPTFAYQILSEQRRAKRNKLLQLGFAMGLGVNSLSELLERGGTNPLSPRSTRDVAIAYCRSRNMELGACDETLFHMGIETIQKGYPNIRRY